MRAGKSIWRMSVPYLFLFPQLVLVGAFSLYPFIYNLVLSFQEFRFSGSQYIGLSNYTNLFADPVFRKTLMNTCVYSIGAVPLTIILALSAAVALNQKIRARALFRTAFLFPNLVSWVVIGLIWKWMYSVDYGVFNQILGFFGVHGIRWLQDPSLTIPSIVAASVWHDVGYYMVIILAGLQSISPSYYEAAKMDGANAWQQFYSITLPLLKPILFIVAVLSMIHSFKVFDQIFVMTSGGPGRASLMIVNYIISLSIDDMKLGYAAALSMILFLAILGLTIIQRLIFKDKDLEG
jgi:multiple sugar transport system permease protein